MNALIFASLLALSIVMMLAFMPDGFAVDRLGLE